MMGYPLAKKLAAHVKKHGVVRAANDVLDATFRQPTTSKAPGPNPKDVVGSAKAAMLLFPPIAMIHAVDAMMDGAGKYDPYNWRAKDITTSNYLHAAIRHIFNYWEGEESARDSKAKHLGHAIATLAIVLDAQAHGCLIDDRPKSDGGAAVNEAFEIVKANEAFRKARRQAEQLAKANVGARATKDGWKGPRRKPCSKKGTPRRAT